MSSLPDIGRIFYNGFTFPTETETTNVSVKPVYDRAERTVISSRFSITVRTTISTAAIDAVVSAGVIKLSHPGMPFHYSGRGLPITINVASVRDVTWGPKPRDISYKPLGGGRAGELTWTVEFEAPTCSGAFYTGPMEFNFTLNYDVSRNGSSTRTYSGHVRVANNRVAPGARVPLDNADKYRDQIYPDLLQGFRRIPGGFTLSEDRSTLEFRIVDEQMGPNVPPPGIIEVSAEHTIGSMPKNYYTWNGTISATYEIARNGIATEKDALNAFGKLCRDRIGYTLSQMGHGPLPPSSSTQFTANGTPIGAQNFSSQGGGSPANVLPAAASMPGSIESSSNLQNQPAKTVIPIKFDFSEPEIYGPAIKCRFSLSYMVIGVHLRDIIGASGMWRPVPDNDWRIWAASMGDVLGPRGHAQLAFDVRDDQIIDLCKPDLTESDLAQRAGSRTVYGRPWTIGSTVFRPPEPDTSWISYENSYRIESDDGTIATKKLPKKEVPRRHSVLRILTTKGEYLDGEAALEYQRATNNAGAVVTNILSPAESVIDFGLSMAEGLAEVCGVAKRGPTIAIYMVGSALRVNYPIACPELVDAGGVVPEPANRRDRGEGFWTGVVGNAGWPVVAAKWKLRYLLAEMPKEKIELPQNPLFGAKRERG